MEYEIETKLNVSYLEAIDKVKESLAKEGFGILSEIDVKATLKKKLGVEFENYIILGACNPSLAYKALQAEIQVGVFLPCNVVIYEKNNCVFVSIINPVEAMSIVDNDELSIIAKEAESRLRRVIGGLKNEK